MNVKIRKIFLGLLITVVCATASYAAETILCFGDSITRGTYIEGKWTPGNSWVNMLEARSEGALKCINAGRGGRKTHDKNELLSWIESYPKVDRVILYLGVNDLVKSTDEVMHQCVKNTRWMVTESHKAYGEKVQVLLIGSPGLSLEIMPDRIKNGGYNAAEQAKLDKLRTLLAAYAASEKNCEFLDLWGVVSPQNYSDGLHPNLAGQSQTADAIWVHYVNKGASARVACVGDSITFGAAIKNREKQCYPVQLGALLGEGYEVSNFGISARTLLKKGDKPYWNEKIYQDALDLHPNYVIIKLGTNDVKPVNWKHKEEFKANLKEMAKAFMALPTHPRVFLSYPVPVQQSRWGISDQLIKEGVIPFVKEVAEELKLEVIDFYTGVPAVALNFADGVHPNAAGAKLMAETAWKSLKDRELPQGSSP